MTESSAVTAAALAETNAFARPWALDLGLPDFAAVRHEDIEPAVRAGMAAQRREWEAVACDGAEPTIANTVAALERSGELLDRALTVLGTLTSTTHCPDLDELEEALAPELSAHTDAHDLDVRLYRRFKALDDLVRAAREAGVEPVDADGAPVDGPTARLIRLTVEAFERDGVALTGADADRLRAINSRLTGLTTRFGTLAANAMHAAGVANFTADPGLATAESHAARVELLARSMGRGLGGEYDTRGLVVEIARLRAERAALLGYPHHAAVVAAGSAAGTAEAVAGMLGRLTPAAMANARLEAEACAARMAADPRTRPGETFGPADWPRYERVGRRERFGLDDAVLAPYLELWSVVERGVFYAATRLYGITFHERTDLAERMYDPDVRVWEVRDGAGADAPVLGLFVGDYYARRGKRGGAWMGALVDQSRLTGRRPAVS